MKLNCSNFLRTTAVLIATGVAFSSTGFAQPSPQSAPIIGSVKKLFDHLNANGGNNPRSHELFDALSKQITDGTSNIKGYIEQELVTLAKGKSTQDVDKLIIARAIKAGAPPDVIAAVNSAGGPTRVFGQLDKHTGDFLREAKALTLRPHAALSVEDIVAALLLVSPAEARMGAVRSWACSVFVFSISFGYGSDSNYATCMN